MSGRGATSRKAIKKNIEKTEKKKEAKEFADELARPPSESGWNLPIRGTSSNRRGSFTASISTHSSDRSRGSDKIRAATPGLFGSEAKDQKRYAVKGKETTAPRGRGGGVPPKSAQSTSETFHSNESYESDPRSAKGVPPHLSDREKVWANMKIWNGNGQPTLRWRGFEHDTDMYMPTGDCLVYFSEDNNSHNEPRPMLRVHIDKLQEARSSFLSNLVTYGEIEQEDYSPPPSVTGSATSPPACPLTSSNLGYLDEDTISPTRDPSDRASSADLSNQEVEVTHEIWFPAPSYIKTPHAQRRHHVATRNFLALLYNKPIVGSDLFEMLSELQMVMDIMYELNEPNRRPNTAAIIVDYIVERRLDDVRGSLTNALGLLAWSEKLDVGWDQGYLESFVHAVGMLTRSSFDRPEFKRLSPVTRHNLEKAYNGMQIKVLNAEEKLSTFAFPELWHLPNVVANSPAFRASESFRDWLKRYFARTFEQWPPKTHQHGHWVTRELVHKLQGDFGAIYDVLINRDIVWTDNEARHTRKWEMVSKTAMTDIFSPDLPGMPITDMLISFDNQHGYLHIPHPYPLLPRRVSSLTAAPAKKKNIFGIGKKDKTASPRDPSEHMKISLAFGDATNINKLGMMLEANDLRDEFLEYEKAVAADLRDVPAADARLGRWLLLYGILQVLSTLSVDTEGIKYKSDVPYFLSPSLENCPPWPPARSLTGTRRVPSAVAVREASQRQSHCWLAPLRWEGGSEAAAVELNAGGEVPLVLTSSPRHNQFHHHHHQQNLQHLQEDEANTLLPPPPRSESRISELDGRLLNERDRKVRMHQFEQKLLAQRREFDEYEARFAGLRGATNHEDRPLTAVGEHPQQQQERRRRGSEKEYYGVVSAGAEDMLPPPLSRGRDRKESFSRPDVPLRSPLRSPPGSRMGRDREREKELPRRLMEYFVDEDDVEGKREGEFLPGALDDNKTTTTTTIIIIIHMAITTNTKTAIPPYGKVHARVVLQHLNNHAWATRVANHFSTSGLAAARGNDGTLAIFSDGAKSERGGGFTTWAVVWRHPLSQQWVEEGGVLPDNKSNHSAEIFAFGQALVVARDVLARFSGMLHTVKIFTDYNAILRSLAELATAPQARHGWRKDWFDRVLHHEGELWLEHPAVALDLHWVPSHAGIEGNVRADRRAGEEIEEHLARLEEEVRRRAIEESYEWLERAEEDQRLEELKQLFDLQDWYFRPTPCWLRAAE
ncbi:hypothetical protein B0J12DRAFT_741073 [Macrophomina phaseolina]|uniref:RNase H type-1 domain-containing protein n=1 Tax=Macrophomina phaseolina TaxID=35725 RepID=A0ABQ8G8R7_9PEZI|nr:hypothetical protein B0J12DRAFT_741073 [Macrophomina phaseolina]